MATITWVEDSESRTATIVRPGRKATSTYVKSWKLFGSSDDTEVHKDIVENLDVAALYWTYPPSEGNVKLQADSYTLEYLGGDAWHLTVNYSKEGVEDEDQTGPIRRSRSFDTAGGQEHRTLAIASRKSVKDQPNTTFADKLIGFDGQSVNGVDVIVPQLSWQENYEVPASYVTAAYIKTVSKLTGSVNDALFRGFKDGEVLFLGCSGSQEWDAGRGDGPWALSYKFAISPNAGDEQQLPALTVGDIADIEKKGHEYLDVFYEDDVKDNRIWKVPKTVYVHQVYPIASFSGLGIGST